MSFFSFFLFSSPPVPRSPPPSPSSVPVSDGFLRCRRRAAVGLFFPLRRQSRHYLWSLAVNRRPSLSSFLCRRSPSLLAAVAGSLKPTTSLLFSLHGLRSPAPLPRCSTSSLLSLSVSSSPTSRLLLPSSPSPSSPSSTSPLPWSPSATLFLPDVLPVGDHGIRKGVQILRHLRTANPISPLTSLLSLSSVAATTTVGPGPGPGPSSIADRRRPIDLLRHCRRSLTVDLLPSCPRPPPLTPLSVILTVNLPKFLCLVVLPPPWLATAGGIGTLAKPWYLAVVIWSWGRVHSLMGQDNGLVRPGASWFNGLGSWLR